MSLFLIFAWAIRLTWFFVYRLAGECPMVDGRDTWWHDEMATVTADCECEWVESEHPLFMLYTSGSTGKPKGIVHSTAGYMLGEFIFNLCMGN